MRVILLRDVARLGRKDEAVDAPDGYARNFLFPRALAAPATPERVRELQARAAAAMARSEASAAAFSKFLEQIGAEPIVIRVRAGERGHLFQGLREVDIARALTEKAGMTVDASAVALARPIKEVGEYQVALSAHGRTGTVTIQVEAEQP